MIRAAFKANLDLRKADAAYGNLAKRVTYDSSAGYGKSWDLTQTTIDAIYVTK